MKRAKIILAAVMLVSFSIPVSTFALSEPEGNQVSEEQKQISPATTVKTISVKDVDLQLGEKWDPSLAFNYIEMSDGIRFDWQGSVSQMTVEGKVDSSITGVYKVTYSFGGKKATANVNVKELEVSKVQEISLRNDDHQLGVKWNPSENFNFVMMTDGTKLSWNEVGKDVKVTGNVDVQKPGVYKVTYTYQGQSATANVNVKELEVSKVQELSVKDADHQLGNKWDPSENFNYVMMTDGTKLNWNEVGKDVKVTGNVDVQKPGAYKVVFEYQGVKSQATVNVKEMEVIKTQEVSVKNISLALGAKWDASQNFNYVMLTSGIKLSWNEVKDKIIVTSEDGKTKAEQFVDTNKAGEYKLKYTYEDQSATAIVKVGNQAVKPNPNTNNKKILPQTGEEQNTLFLMVGIAIVLTVLGVVIFKRRKKV